MKDALILSPSAEPLRFRQVHLDFHTSEHIAGVGSKFDKKQFQEMLQLGHVNSITCFSKCHHGWTYHDTSIGARHPQMHGELLPQQLEACREIDVKVPIYLSAGLDEKSAREHPEWLVMQRDGHLYNPLFAGWKLMCFNSPYLDYLCAQIEEVVDRFDPYGIFLDIISAKPCYCSYCMRDMLAGGYDPENEKDVWAFAKQVLKKYYRQTNIACTKNNPNIRVFHNSGHIPRGAHYRLHVNTHLELESLPTGGWGYDHFPLSARYTTTTGMDFLGMTGKFHTTWGEFGGFKRDAALQYECAAMLSLGAKCSIGDQLHPSGEANYDTYRSIGAAYSQVEAKERWCTDAKCLAEVAVVSVEARLGSGEGGHNNGSAADEGVTRMLLESHMLFHVVDLGADLTQYKLVILPDSITLEGEFAEKIEAYLANGGKVLASGSSGMNPECTEFVIDAGLKVKGKSEWNPDYVVPGDKLPTPIVRGPFVLYGGAYDVVPDGAEVLAGRRKPYFNRRYNHFCSHQHTPDECDIAYPAVTTTGQVAYFAHDIFAAYRRYGQPLYRDMFIDVVRSLIDTPMLEVSLPTAGRASIMRQESENRDILHLLYATPSMRGGVVNGEGWAVEIIDDLVPIYDIKCRMNVGYTASSVTLVPDGQLLPFTNENGVIEFTVPKVYCHQMVEIKGT